VSEPPRDRARTAAPPQRRATQPQRQFRPDELAGTPRAQRRKLCHVLLTETGSRVVEYHNPAAYDELLLEVLPLWRQRRVRVRIAARAVEQNDVDRLAERVRQAGDADGLLIAPLGVAEGVTAPARVAIVEPEELITRLERSAQIVWPDRLPTPAYDRVGTLRRLESDAALLDPVGIRWLPTLALNELPVELFSQRVSPQDLLERMAFRLLTATFRFGGERHGEAARGERLPDSTLTWPAAAEERLAALVDCKAASEGYTMSSDHLLRFVGYVEAARPEFEAAGYDLRYLVVVSSDFSGRTDDRHPFHGRAAELRERARVELSYVRAVDLARLAAIIEGRELSPLQREQLDWRTALDHGLVTAEHLEAMVPEGDA
jgi:hypothetical protein